SMFTGPWKVHSPEIKDDSDECQGFGQIAIDYYAYLFEQKDKINKENFIVSRYSDLVASPKEQVLGLYDYFGLEASDDFKNALGQVGQKNKKYKSTHSYTLAQYGYEKEMISTQLDEFMTTYNFDKDKDV
ncbi:MAG: hypothetical protein ACPG4Z_01870, partial [Chitinophagales bacterium]